MKKQLEELRSLLIIVDMVNGFVKEGALADPNIQKIIPRQLELLKQYLNEKSAVVFIKDTHEKESSEFKNFPPHCIKGTEEGLRFLAEWNETNETGISGEEKGASGASDREAAEGRLPVRRLRAQLLSFCTRVQGASWD